MFERALNLLKSNSFFLFGARGTGKSTLLREEFAGREVLWVDLLLPEEEQVFAISPKTLSERLDALSTLPEWVVIDEVQKVPKLLDVIHFEIEHRPEAKRRSLKFAMTGSSARKLKRGASNLLAGRAFTNNLFPLTHVEYGSDFHLMDILHWGALPYLSQLTSDEERKAFLDSYVHTYLKEEIFQEQLVRNTTPFRKFISIAAQSSGSILNLNKIASDLGVDWTTVKNYFEILEDTLLGFMLPAYSKSLRKQQLKASKFYLFDIGVQRALTNSLKIPVGSGQILGPLFEHFIVCELHRLNEYRRADFQLSYLATQGGLEIDLIIERPGAKDVLVEIKSTERVQESHLKHISAMSADFDQFEAICISRESSPRKVGKVMILPWKNAFEYLELV